MGELLPEKVISPIPKCVLYWCFVGLYTTKNYYYIVDYQKDNCNKTEDCTPA